MGFNDPNPVGLEFLCDGNEVYEVCVSQNQPVDVVEEEPEMMRKLCSSMVIAKEGVNNGSIFDSVRIGSRKRRIDVLGVHVYARVGRERYRECRRVRCKR